MRKTFIDTLLDLAEDDQDIVLVTCDMGYSVLEPFIERYPERSINAGIAEQNAISVAAGLALSGKKPYVYTIIPFLIERAFEQIRIDIAYMKSNVKLVGIGSGYTYGTSGTTHHAIEDISLMRSLPNMMVCCPGDNSEAKQIIEKTANVDEPVYIRIGRHNRGIFNSSDITIGKGSIIQSGSDIAVFTTGNTLPDGFDYCEKLCKEGRNPYLVSMHTIKPLDVNLILDFVREGIEIHTLEEHSIIGGLGTAISEVIAESGKGIKFKRIGIPDEFTHLVGDRMYLKKQYGLYFGE